MFKGMVELLSSGELKSIGDNVRDAAGPWTVKTKSSAGSQAGEEVDIEVEISLPSLDPALIILALFASQIPARTRPFPFPTSPLRSWPR